MPLAGGTRTILVDGKKVAQARIERTQVTMYLAEEPADVGLDNATPVMEDQKERDNQFTGRIGKVTIDIAPGKLGAADEEELRLAEHRLRMSE